MEDDQKGSSNDYALLFCVALITLLDAPLAFLSFLSRDFLPFILSLAIMLVCILGLTSMKADGED